MRETAFHKHVQKVCVFMCICGYVMGIRFAVKIEKM
jgi:hypothetical protein